MLLQRIYKPERKRSMDGGVASVSLCTAAMADSTRARLSLRSAGVQRVCARDGARGAREGRVRGRAGRKPEGGAPSSLT